VRRLIGRSFHGARGWKVASVVVAPPSPGWKAKAPARRPTAATQEPATAGASGETRRAMASSAAQASVARTRDAEHGSQDGLERALCRGTVRREAGERARRRHENETRRDRRPAVGKRRRAADRDRRSGREERRGQEAQIPGQDEMRQGRGGGEDRKR
jgi:hypothetical protein